MMQNFFVLISKYNIVKLNFWLSRLCLCRKMLLARVGKFRLIQDCFNAVKSCIHNGKARCFPIKSFQRSKEVKHKQQNTKHIGQRKCAALFQYNRQAENRRNTNAVKDIQTHCPWCHFLLKSKGGVSGTLEIVSQFF